MFYKGAVQNFVLTQNLNHKYIHIWRVTYQKYLHDWIRTYHNQAPCTSYKRTRTAPCSGVVLGMASRNGKHSMVLWFTNTHFLNLPWNDLFASSRKSTLPLGRTGRKPVIGQKPVISWNFVFIQLALDPKIHLYHKNQDANELQNYNSCRPYPPLAGRRHGFINQLASKWCPGDLSWW